MIWDLKKDKENSPPPWVCQLLLRYRTRCFSESEERSLLNQDESLRSNMEIPKKNHTLLLIPNVPHSLTLVFITNFYLLGGEDKDLCRFIPEFISW